MSAKDLLGSLYFSAERDEQNRPVSKYEGVVKALVIRRDDGSEFTVESAKLLPISKLSLKKDDLKTLAQGTQLQCISTGASYYVVKVFPTYGDVWLRDNETGKIVEKKYTDLRRIA